VSLCGGLEGRRRQTIVRKTALDSETDNTLSISIGTCTTYVYVIDFRYHHGTAESVGAQSPRCYVVLCYVTYVHCLVCLRMRTQTPTSYLRHFMAGTRPVCKNIGDRAFSVAGPTVWNSLPEPVRSAETLSSFKRKLKTYLFNISF